MKLAIPPGGDRPRVINPEPGPRPGSAFLRPDLRALIDRIRPMAQSLAARQMLLLVEDLADFVALCAELRAVQRRLETAKARKDWQAARLLQGEADQLARQVDERELALRGEPDEDQGPPELGGPR